MERNGKPEENKPPLGMGKELKKYQTTEMQKRYLVEEMIYSKLQQKQKVHSRRNEE